MASVGPSVGTPPTLPTQSNAHLIPDSQGPSSKHDDGPSKLHTRKTLQGNLWRWLIPLSIGFVASSLDETISIPANPSISAEFNTATQIVWMGSSFFIGVVGNQSQIISLCLIFHCAGIWLYFVNDPLQDLWYATCADRGLYRFSDWLMPWRLRSLFYRSDRR